MMLRRPNSLSGLIFAGFTLVAVPLLIGILWALYNLDRLAEQSERLVLTGVSAAEQNRILLEQIGSLDRIARQYQILRNSDTLALLRQDYETINATLDEMLPLAQEADAVPLTRSVRVDVQHVLATLENGQASPEALEEAIAGIVTIRGNASELSSILSAQIDRQLVTLQERTDQAQRVAAWQAVALVPATIVMVLIFSILVARPIRQIDNAIGQLGQSGFSKTISISGPRDLERLGRQLEWLRTRLLELAQEKNRFLRHMSHELKTPLANIREGTELLLDGAVGELDEDQREVTDILRSNGLKLQQLIENLLAFSAWQAKSESLSLTDFPLRALIIKVAKAQQLALKAAGIRLKLAAEDFVVTADEEKMRVVLDNLLSNAVKFTPRGGEIVIRAHSEADKFVLEFADTGPGIPEAERPRIFEAFFQGQREQGGQVGGTGIGLSVVLECVQAHDGAIELVESEDYPGACFRIQIPQQRAIRDDSFDDERFVASA